MRGDDRKPALPWLREGLWVLGALEQRVMAAVWDTQGLSFPELCERIGASQSAATVTTVLRRLMDKGLLRRTGTRRNFLYRATMSQSEFNRYVSYQIAGRLLDQVGSEAVAYFVDAAATANPDLLDELEEQVRLRKQAVPMEDERV